MHLRAAATKGKEGAYVVAPGEEADDEEDDEADDADSSTADAEAA